jgi:3-oxoacyl-ACP reductase-like protein
VTRWLDDAISADKKIAGPRYALAFFVLQLACSKVTILHPNFIISLSFWITSVWCGFIISYSAYKRIIKRSRINWNEEIAVVTGSSGGLGIAIVSALKAKGCRVVCIDIVQSKNTKVVDDDRTLYIQADLTDIKQVNALPGMIKSTFDRGSATIVISNAGVMIGRKVLDFEEGQFER